MLSWCLCWASQARYHACPPTLMSLVIRNQHVHFTHLGLPVPLRVSAPCDPLMFPAPSILLMQWDSATKGARDQSETQGVDAPEADFDHWRRPELRNKFFPRDRLSADSGVFTAAWPAGCMQPIGASDLLAPFSCSPPLLFPHTPAFLTVFPCKPASLLRPCVWGPWSEVEMEG